LIDSDGKSAPLKLAMHAGDSDVRVTKGWQTGTLSISADNAVFLTLDDRAGIAISGGDPFSMSPSTLGRMDFAGSAVANVVVNSSAGLGRIDIGESSLDVVGFNEIGRSLFGGKFGFNHTEARELTMGLYSGAQYITPNISVNLMPGTTLRLTEAWSGISGRNKLVITGKNGKVVCDGDSVPDAIDVTDGSIAVSVRKRSGLSGGAIAGIVIGCVVVVVAGVGVGFYLYRRGGKPLWDYDAVDSKVDPNPLLGVQL
jgi:hypothetical protein